METTGSNGGSKTPRWIVIGCATVLVCAAAACVGGVVGLYWVGSQTAEEVAVRLDVPATMDIGEDVEFRIVVTNITSETVKVNSVDISTNYLSGMVIQFTEPSFTEIYQYSWMNETFQTYYFDVSVPAQETVTIVFHGRAVSGGDFSGSMDVCINTFFNCKKNIVRTVIE
jgi:hypothetical protein